MYESTMTEVLLSQMITRHWKMLSRYLLNFMHKLSNNADTNVCNTLFLSMYCLGCMLLVLGLSVSHQTFFEALQRKNLHFLALLVLGFGLLPAATSWRRSCVAFAAGVSLQQPAGLRMNNFGGNGILRELLVVGM
jgi:hypothetical protein